MGREIERREFLGMVAGGAVGLAAATTGCSKPGGTVRRPNVVILFVDDLGYGDLSCYGHPTIFTPNIDRMAREGLRLTSFCVAAPTCTPSRAALLTGRYPIRCGLPHVLGPESENGLSKNEITIASALKTEGYRTAAIGKWHLGHARKEFMPTSHGFDSYFGLLYSNDMIRPWVKTDVPLRLYRNEEPTDEYPVDQSTLTDRYTEEAIRFIRGNSDRPFLLYLAYTMVHLPLGVSDRCRGKSRAGLYGDAVECIDWSVGEILSELNRLGLDENTLVIFTSDNGPWCNMPPRMLQKGIEKWHAGTPGLLRGAKATTYEGGVRVPCIIRWPGVVPEGRISADLLTSMDFFPTILNVAGAEVPSDRPIDGNDALAFFKGEAPSPTREFYYFRGWYLEAVREGEWKYRLTSHARDDLEPGQRPTPELFNLDIDPGERYNMADRHPEIVTRLDRKLRVFAQELGAKVAT